MKWDVYAIFAFKKTTALEFKFIDHKSPLLNEVKALWRKNASTLGFFPEDAFLEHARKKYIITAVDKGKLCGYLLFRIATSTSRIGITHLCVPEEKRGQGINLKLLDQLVNKFHETSLRGIGLYCREDYKAACRMWEKYGFKPLNEKKGKNLEGHQLIYWWYDFGKPDLFTGLVDTSKLQAVVDANIIIHLRDDLSDYNQEAYALLTDWVINEVEYYYAPETYNEIIRDEDSERRQKTRKSLKRFKQISVSKRECDKIFNKVDSIISGSSKNDKSDKRQLAEAICSGFEYFITRDANLLNHSVPILEKLGISVLKPNQFILELDELNNAIAYQPVRLSGANYNIQKVGGSEINEIANYFHCGGEQEPKKDFETMIVSLSGDVKQSDIKIVKDVRENKIALIGKKNCDGGICEIPILRIKKGIGRLSNTLFHQLISDKITEAVKNNQKIIKLSEKYLSPEYNLTLQSLNFFKEKDTWIKASLKGLINSRELLSKYSFLINYSCFKTLTEDLVNTEEEQKKSIIKLDLERRLYPVKFSDLNLPTYIIPIKPYWASHLFDTPSANQSLFGATPELAWSRENIYYRCSRSNGLTFPARILWYLSEEKGFARQKSMIGISYLDEIEVNTAKSLFKKHYRFGIYKWQDILKLAGHHDNLIMAIKFSDTQLFSIPIPYNNLKQILFDHNSKKYTFQSPVKISHEIFLHLYKIGMKNS